MPYLSPHTHTHTHPLNPSQITQIGKGRGKVSEIISYDQRLMQVGRDIHKLSSPTSWLNRTRFLRSLFRQILKTLKDDDCTGSLGSCLTSWLSSWEIWISWPHLSVNLLVSMGRLLLGPLKPSLLQAKQNPFLQLPLTGQVLQPDCQGDILLNLLQFINVFSSEEPKTCTI